MIGRGVRREMNEEKKNVEGWIIRRFAADAPSPEDENRARRVGRRRARGLRVPR
jgi:hypothetical protein